MTKSLSSESCGPTRDSHAPPPLPRRLRPRRFSASPARLDPTHGRSPSLHPRRPTSGRPALYSRIRRERRRRHRAGDKNPLAAGRIYNVGDAITPSMGRMDPSSWPRLQLARPSRGPSRKRDCRRTCRKIWISRSIGWSTLCAFEANSDMSNQSRPKRRCGEPSSGNEIIFPLLIPRNLTTSQRTPPSEITRESSPLPNDNPPSKVRPCGTGSSS